MKLHFVTLALIFGQGCSTLADANEPNVEWLAKARSDGCEVIPYAVMWLAFCGDVARENSSAWMVGVAETVVAQDAALHELGLPPLSGHLQDTLVRLYDAPSPDGGSYSGQYHGYLEPETKSILLWLKDDYGTPHQSALAHEFMHLYDHYEFSIKSLDEWYEVVERGRHFLVPVVAEYAIKHGRAGPGQNPPTAMEAIVCGLDFRDNLHLDGGPYG